MLDRRQLLALFGATALVPAGAAASPQLTTIPFGAVGPTVAGDLLIMVSGSADQRAPAGWTTIGTFDPNGRPTTLFWRTATGDEKFSASVAYEAVQPSDDGLSDARCRVLVAPMQGTPERHIDVAA